MEQNFLESKAKVEAIKRNETPPETVSSKSSDYSDSISIEWNMLFAETGNWLSPSLRRLSRAKSFTKADWWKLMDENSNLNDSFKSDSDQGIDELKGHWFSILPVKIHTDSEDVLSPKLNGD